MFLWITNGCGEPLFLSPWTQLPKHCKKYAHRTNTALAKAQESRIHTPDQIFLYRKTCESTNTCRKSQGLGAELGVTLAKLPKLLFLSSLAIIWASAWLFYLCHLTEQVTYYHRRYPAPIRGGMAIACCFWSGAARASTKNILRMRVWVVVLVKNVRVF